MADLDDITLPVDGDEVPPTDKPLEVDENDPLEEEEEEPTDDEVSDDDGSSAE